MAKTPDPDQTQRDEEILDLTGELFDAPCLAEVDFREDHVLFSVCWFDDTNSGYHASCWHWLAVN